MSVKLTYEYHTVATATGTISKDVDDYFIDATAGNIVLTLPSASATGLKGKIFTFRKIDSTTNTASIAAAGTDTIDGSARLTIDNFAFATGATITPNLDVAEVDNSAAAATVSLPLANSVPLGTRIIAMAIATTAVNTVTVNRTGADTINGSAAGILVPYGSGKTFFTTSASNWAQY